VATHCNHHNSLSLNHNSTYKTTNEVIIPKLYFLSLCCLSIKMHIRRHLA